MPSWCPIRANPLHPTNRTRRIAPDPFHWILIRARKSRIGWTRRPDPSRQFSENLLREAKNIDFYNLLIQTKKNLDCLDKFSDFFEKYYFPYTTLPWFLMEVGFFG